MAERTKQTSRLNSKRKRQLGWILAGCVALLVQYLGSYFPSGVESVYGKAIFPLIRTIMDHSFALLPFPVAILVFSLLLWYWIHLIRQWRKKPRRDRIPSILWSFISGLGATIFFFYLLWGMNYKRPGLEERLGISPQKLDSMSVRKEYYIATGELSSLVGTDSVAITLSSGNRPRSLDDLLRPHVEETMAGLGYSTKGRVQVRVIGLKGFLLVWNTAGIYFPFSGEGHVDGGLLEIQLPAVIAHEMAHGYGLTDEGECNFLSWLSCSLSSEPAIRYSSALSYWRHCASVFRRLWPEEFKRSYDQLPPMVKADLEAIQSNNARYPEFFPRLRNITYDQYLKAQGIREGLLSYDKVIELVHAYRQQNGFLLQQ